MPCAGQTKARRLTTFWDTVLGRRPSCCGRFATFRLTAGNGCVFSWGLRLRKLLPLLAQRGSWCGLSAEKAARMALRQCRELSLSTLATLLLSTEYTCG